MRRATALAATCALAAPAFAAAHLERPSYWPDPGPDRSVSPAAGGEVPKPRSLSSAVSENGPGEVRVVCKGDSLAAAKRSIAGARKNGFRLRPSQPRERLSAGEARELLRANRTFERRCEFDSIQEAIDASGNNDRVVVMPGRYTEPESREEPTNDPRCNPSLLQEDQSGALTPSYEYQAKCPHDQNLVYVQGRAVEGDPLPSPRADRHGIPEQEHGDCVRCNLQLEGSGPRPEDVIIDGGEAYEGDPMRPEARPTEFAKHVVLRTDRSDGFVGRNFVVRGASEHGFYTEETDGILLDRVKFYWGRDYGHLSFTTDHNVVRNCDGLGSSDAVVYPGAAPQTGDFRDEDFYPEQRHNTVIKRCDLHGSALGYSGSMGNSVRITRNHIYGNTTGITSDTLSAPGHPGFPSDGIKIDHNYIYSNNLNLYRDDAPFESYVPGIIGAGFIYLGVNDGTASDNWIFDNWRLGAAVVAVPDETAGEPDGNVDHETHCGPPGTLIATTSCGNRYFNNRLGQIPPGFERHPGLSKFGNRSAVGSGASTLPNGVDFFWDEFVGNTGNCWYGNEGPDGTGASVTWFAGVPPDPLPSACGSSVGLGDAVKEAIVVDCAMWERGQTGDEHPLCIGFDMPPRPGTAAASAEQRARRAEAREFMRSPDGLALESRLDEIAAQSGLSDQRR